VKTLWWTLVWGALAGLVIGSSALFHAHAAVIQEPSMCVEFDASPTFATVNAVMYDLISSGNSVDKAAELLVQTVEQHCPQRIPLLQAYVDAGVFLYPELSR
jgi:hypothetical protein